MKNLFAKIAVIGLMFAGICQAHQNVVIIFDESGSMTNLMGSEDKITAAKRGLIQVINTLPDDSTVGILTLNHGWLVDTKPIDKNNLDNAIMNLQAGGGTPLGAALKTGADALLKIRGKTPYGSFRLLIVTDGEETDTSTLQQNYPEIIARGITFDVIGVMMNSEHSLAKVARSYRNVTDSNSLKQAMHDALAETTVDSNSTESDFDWLAPLPDDVAKSVVQTLAEIPTLNYPIGEKPPEKIGAQSQVDNQQQQPTQAAAAVSGPSAGDIILVIVGVMVAIVVIFVIIAMLSAS